MRSVLGMIVLGLSLAAAGWNSLAAQEPARTLRVRSVKQDPDLPARTVERLEQLHNGVRIWGADLVRNAERGAVVSTFGTLAPPFDLVTVPTLDLAAATSALAGPDQNSLLTRPELVIAPLPKGGYALTYTAVVGNGGINRIFIDAHTGEEVWRYSELIKQQAVGTGTGVVGDTKKLSVAQVGGAFVASDTHRPPALNTYDMKGNLTRTKNVLLNGAPLSTADLATDADNVWTDPPVVDAHAYLGWTYDYFFKRFGRHGLDDRDRAMIALTNPVSQQAALTLPADDSIFSINAFWCSVCGPNGQGVMLFGNGIPSNFTFGGQSYTYLAGALDVVAHELTHAVTSYTSGLIGANEAGALNESFSDMMGVSAEFYYKSINAYTPPADYVLAEDVIRASRPGTVDGIRSMSNPALFGSPDHYRNRYVGDLDDGGIHINTGIPNQAFYLAIEGGTNRTSGLSVTGVGAANREQIERVFYRAFTLMLPANATFVTARTATTQAARDLFGAGSRPEQAVEQAWTAVGVPDERTIATYTAVAAARTQVSSAFTMATTGTYQVNLRGNDPNVDLDLYLTPNTAACSTSPVQESCILIRSITGGATESVKWPVRAGESYRIWVDNLGQRSSSFIVEHFVTP